MDFRCFAITYDCIGSVNQGGEGAGDVGEMGKRDEDRSACRPLRRTTRELNRWRAGQSASHFDIAQVAAAAETLDDGFFRRKSRRDVRGRVALGQAVRGFVVGQNPPVEPLREAGQRLPDALDVRQIDADRDDVSPLPLRRTRKRVPGRKYAEGRGRGMGAQPSSSASRRRIASIAAMQPMPAAVIACR